jgi:creatinine amidohydrolase
MTVMGVKYSNPIQFDELTWPEVAALPRDLPIILPLGGDFDLERLDPGADTWALLPPIPYGWPGSPIAVAPRLFEQLLANLFGCLKEDGFQNLFLLHTDTHSYHLPGVCCLVAEMQNNPAAIPNLDSQHVVLIPLGHTEQHGFHLPLNTDSVIIEGIARGVCIARPEATLALPTLPYGVSTHRASFAGTFNIGGRVFEDFMLAILAELFARGADRFYLLNGHGGNHSFLVNVIKFAGERFPQAFTATAWLHTSGVIGSTALESFRRSKRGGMGHAGELETALMLRLRPDLVHMERVVDETDFIASEAYYMDWIEGGELIANPPWSDDTQTGSYGAGSLATTENGARWLHAAIEEKLAHVSAIHEQQDRRKSHRSQSRLSR